MAQVMTTRMIDDLDGGEADEEVLFGLDGKVYEIDLSSANAERLRSVLAEFIGAGRKVSGGTSSRRSALTVHQGGSSKPQTDRAENQRVRAWAIGQGMKVAERGRIPSEITEAYKNRDQGYAKPAPKLAPTPKLDAEQHILNPKVDPPKPALASVPATVIKPKKGKTTPAPRAGIDLPINDDEVMAWWTGVKKFKAPKGDKVNSLMRGKYRMEVLAPKQADTEQA